jgi:4-amino-4-deoxy-L-arabinose transferase-like glycosyltransferase
MIFDFRFAICDLNRQSKIGNRQSKIGNPQIGNRQSAIENGSGCEDGMKRYAGVGLVVLVAFALRVYQLDAVSLRGDEAFTVVFVQRPWEGLWRGISTIEPNPPLMYLALRVWIAIAGASEFVTRYFSVFFGVLCVPLVYRLVRVMFTEARLALVAAALVAINPYQIWHSQDVRNYTMWPCLSLLALVFLWQWWRGEIRDWRLPASSVLRRSSFVFRPSSFVLRPLSLYVLATLASLYTHYYDTFILAAVNVFVVSSALVARRTSTLARWIGAQGVLVALYAPWVLFGTNRIMTYGEGSAESGVTLLDVFRRTLASFVLSDTVPETFKATLWLPLALVLVVILTTLWRQDRARASFLFLWIAIPTLAQYIVSIGRPLFLERYLNGIASAYYVTFAIGLWQLARLDMSRFKQVASDRQQASASRLLPTAYWTRLMLPGLLCFALAAYALYNYYFDPTYAKAPNWRALMQYIKDHREEGDFVIQNFTEMSPYYYRDTLPVMTIPKDFWATPADEKTLRQLSNDYRRLWFIPASPDWWDPNEFVETFLSHHTERVAEIPLDTFRLQLYLTPREFLPRMTRVDARIGAVKLVGYRVHRARALHLALYWQTETRLEKSWVVFTHLVDAEGRVVAQHDGVPAFGRHPTTAWQPGELIVDVHTLRGDVAPGTYTFVVGMYHADSLTRAPAFNAQGARAPNDHIVLTQITLP